MKTCSATLGSATDRFSGNKPALLVSVLLFSEWKKTALEKTEEIKLANIERTESEFASWNPDSGIQEIFACGIRILGFGFRNTAQGIQNPTNDWNPESTAWNSESKNILESLTWKQQHQKRGYDKIKVLTCFFPRKS